MGDIVLFTPAAMQANDAMEATKIDVAKMEASRVLRRLDVNMIRPAEEEVDFLATKEHAADPIKSIDDIMKISDYLIKQNRYRDNMLFIVGINFGLRISDLLRLRFNMILDDDLTFRTSFPILEKKTEHTRKTKRNRYITINDAAIEAITLYLKHMAKSGKTVCLSDYLFRSESNRGSNVNKPLDRSTVDRILKGIAKDLQLTSKMSTHTLRKTFGYHQMVMSGNNPRTLLLLQKIFGHSSSAITLDYIGITSEEIEDAYLSLNLGSRNYYSKANALVDAM